MAGNVWEWCDTVRTSLTGRQADQRSVNETTRAVLGGSYMDTADAMRSGHRLMSAPGYRDLDCGFRSRQKQL